MHTQQENDYIRSSKLGVNSKTTLNEKPRNCKVREVGKAGEQADKQQAILSSVKYVSKYS